MAQIGRKFWDISPLYELKPPKPAKPITCSVCNCNVFYFKHARVFKRFPIQSDPFLSSQYRLDLAIKCHNCARVLIFGIHITEQEYNKLKSIFKNDFIEYVDVGIWQISPTYERKQYITR